MNDPSNKRSLEELLQELDAGERVELLERDLLAKDSLEGRVSPAGEASRRARFLAAARGADTELIELLDAHALARMGEPLPGEERLLSQQRSRFLCSIAVDAAEGDTPSRSGRGSLLDAAAAFLLRWLPRRPVRDDEASR